MFIFVSEWNGFKHYHLIEKKKLLLDLKKKKNWNFGHQLRYAKMCEITITQRSKQIFTRNKNLRVWDTSLSVYLFLMVKYNTAFVCAFGSAEKHFENEPIEGFSFRKKKHWKNGVWHQLRYGKNVWDYHNSRYETNIDRNEKLRLWADICSMSKPDALWWRYNTHFYIGCM